MSNSTKEKTMTAIQAAIKIIEILTAAPTKEAAEKAMTSYTGDASKEAGKVWHDYVHGETWEIERARSRHAIDCRASKIWTLGVYGHAGSGGCNSTVRINLRYLPLWFLTHRRAQEAKGPLEIRAASDEKSDPRHY